MSEATHQTTTEAMSPTESALVEMWRDLLARTDIHRGDSFFESGGTSLTAIKLLQRVEKKFGPDVLSPDTLYEDARLGSLAKAIDEATRRG
ncbi:phosphopantetheine-binding protein [Streptomyces sp. NPDC007095]|jgi:hypothetical protein|uniref:phosphopantetheine-binding protein n=1 Tax=Streptomyces sp. NPDC007095 TaxID=3154482 RepID=UPI000C7028BA